jgi:hypothetical protein
MASADHPHHLKALDRSGCRLHCPKASGGADNPLECSMVCLDDVVEVLAGAMLRIALQHAFSLQPAERFGIGAELISRDGGRQPVVHCCEGLAKKTMGSACVSPVHQYEVDQSAMLVDSPEQILPLAPTFTYVSSTRQEVAR